MADDLHRARSLLQANRLHEARALYHEISLRQPDDADMWLILGALNGCLGDPLAAERCARRATELDPNLPAACFNLGIALREQRRFAEAIEAFRKAIALNPDHAEAHNAIGYMLAAQGRTTAAEQHFRRAVALNPGFADAHNNLGNVLRATARNEEAIRSYHSAIEAQPDHLDAMLNLASLLAKMTRIDEAIAWDRRIISHHPNFAEAHYHMGNLLLGVGRLEEAVACFREAQRIRPDFSEATAAVAHALLKLGRLDESCQHLTNAVDDGKQSAAIVSALATVAKKLDRQQQTIRLAEEMLEANDLSSEERQQLHFAAGKLYDELGQYQAAFDHCRKANALYRGRFPREAHNSRINAAMAVFQPHRMRDLPRARNKSERPIFIVGMPRCGTSLVEQILSSHPNIFGAGELNDINQYANDMQVSLASESPYPACLLEVREPTLDDLAARYLDRLLALDSTAARITDKMPHNFLHLGLIAMLFPQARIIHVQRNPMDTCLSIYFHRFNELHAYAHDLADLGFYYRCYERLMAHWRSVLGLALHEIRYEELVSEPEVTIRRLIDFCDVEWDERCIRFHETSRAVNTPSSEQVRQPIYRHAVKRWRHYETHLDPLRTALEA